MVATVDFEFSRPAEVTLTHSADDGVRFARIDGTGPSTSATWRVRGLQPSELHTLQATVSADGATQDAVIEFTTNDAWAEFFGVIEPVVTDKTPEDVYRLFDSYRIGIGGGNYASLYVYDKNGVPRWHWGRVAGVNGVNATLAALKLDDDGNVFFLHAYDFYKVDELGNILTFIDSSEIAPDGMHHEVIQLPNGNYMALAYDFRTVFIDDLGETDVFGDKIVEFTPAGELVWEWSTFDHLDVNRRLAGFEIVAGNATGLKTGNDWTHGNGLEYDPETDTILFSMRHQDWIIKIDHQTGDVVWRLGIDGDFALQGPGMWFAHQHCPEWQPDGSLMLYDNGIDHPQVPDDQEVSRAVRYALDETGMTATQEWESAKQDELSAVASDADRLPGGNYLILDSNLGALGPGNVSRIREVDPTTADEDVWEIRTPASNLTYRTIWSTRLPGEPAP